MPCFFSVFENFEEIIKTNVKGVRAVEKIATGWTNYVFVAKTRTGRYIFRFPRNVFFASAMEKEITVTQWMRKVFPKLTVNLQKGMADGRIFSRHKMKKGLTLTAYYGKLKLRQKERLTKDLVNYLIRLQEKTPFFEQMFRNHTEVLRERLSDFLMRLSYVNGDENYPVSPIQFLEEVETPALVHGDLNPGNILINKRGRLKAVLDYAFFSHSTPFADAARIIGRMPDDFQPMFEKEFLRQTGQCLPDYLPSLMAMWKTVEEDYIAYIHRECPDIVLPER